MLRERQKLTVKKNVLRRVFAALVAACLCLCVSPTTPARQGGGTTRYVYDANGRLHAIISPSGEAIVYDYDPAGNITAIRRLTDALELLTFSPRQGSAGDLVELVGVGFAQGISSVSFNGVAARIVGATPSSVLAEVPEGATTGPLTVTSQRGATATSAEPFRIFARVRVTPAPARVLPGDSLQFTALVTSLPGDRSVRWSVNGVEGGDGAHGTITPGGLYTAPQQQSGPLVVRATAATDPTLFGESEVSLRINVQNTISPAVSVSRTTLLRTPAVSGLVAVRRGNASGVQDVRSDSLSVRHGSETPVDRASAPAVAVRRGSVTGAAAETSLLVSVRNGNDSGLGATDAPAVAVTSGPNLSAVAPQSVRRGATVTITLTGDNLDGATALHFITDAGAIDSSISVSGLTVSSDGKSVTATLNVSSAAPLGRRVVVVTTPSGVSLTADVGVNVLQIIS